MRKILFFILFLFAFLQHNTFTQIILTLDDVIEYALENNLSLRKAEIDLAASEYSEKNLWSEIFPSISASAGIGYGGSLFSGMSSGRGGPGYNVGIGINLGLNAGIPYAVRSIRLAHQGNILRYEDARNQLSIQVTKRFFALIAEKNNLLLLEEILNLTQRQYVRSETLFRNGFTGELSLLQSEMALENARYDFGIAQINHNINMSEFLAIIGLPADSDILLSGEINITRIEADAEELINSYLPSRPDIVSGQQEIERLANSQMQTIMQSRAPSLSLSFSWSSSSFSPFNDSFSANASVSIPIDSWIPGTSRSQSISRTGDSIEKARLDLQMTENTAKTQIRSLTATLRNSWDSIRIARMSYESAMRNYNLTEQAFLNGIVEAFALEEIRNNMASARQRLLQTELSYFNMILDLSAALNMDWRLFISTYSI